MMINTRSSFYARFPAILAGLILIFSPQTNLQARQQPAPAAPARDVVLVLPFENSSTSAEYNWVGESFADALSDLLTVPGLMVISSDERELIYQRLQLPLTTLPSRATAIKLAREARASLVLLGTYRVTPPQGDKQPAQLQVNARLIRVGEGRYEGSVHDLGGTLPTLQEMHGRLAYEVLYQRDRALPFSRNQIIDRATKVPQRAFESYIKGAMTDDVEKRTAYLTNALREYARAKNGGTYPQAAFEMGHLYLSQSNWKQAAEMFTKVEKPDRHYAESAFYAGLAYWRMNDLTHALSTLVPLAAELPLTSIYNNAGAISVQSAHDEKKPEEHARLLNQGLSMLAQAASSAPDDPTVRFNYGYALFISGKFKEAAEQLGPVLQINKNDGQTYFLYAKALERAGQTQEATTADNDARRYFQAYAKWQTVWEKGQTTPDVQPRLYSIFNRRPFYDKLYKDNMEAATPTEKTNANAEEVLTHARELYQQGRDEEALPELRRVLIMEPMSAEAYLLIGRIHQRRGNLDESISALKTAIFWDAKMIDAHILLGRIFLERGDRAMANTYAKSAIQIDANNQEAMALQRQVTMGSK